MNAPLISVHLIAFNQKEFIEETIDSVLAQEQVDFEIVVADDGSTDGTAEIIQALALKHPERIVPLTGGPNLGITGNSNRGLAACRGRYVAFLGGDDLMLPGKLAKQVELMESHPKCDVSYHNLDVFDHDTGNTLYLFNQRHTPYQGGVKGLIRHGCINGGSSTMVRRSAMPSHGFDKRLPIASDWLFWIETLFSRGGQILYLDEILGRYRRHANNITGDGALKVTPALRDHFDACQKIILSRPEYAAEASHRMGELLRGLRHDGRYAPYLLASMRTSIQWKTAVLLLLYGLSLGTVRR